MSRCLLALVALVVGLLLAGCSSSSSSSDGTADRSLTPEATGPSYDEARERAAATTTLTDFFSVYDPMGQDQGFTRAEARCIARQVVREPGVERLQRMGVLDEDMQYVAQARPRLTRSDAEDLARALFRCSDAEEVARRAAMDQLRVAPAERACARRVLDEGLMARAVALTLLEAPLDPVARDAAEAFAPCRRS